MITRAFDRAAMNWSYEMHLQPMLSEADIKGLPFGSVFGSVPARSVSKRHAHHDGEMFIALSGRAFVVLGEEERELGPGEVVYLSPFKFHEIRNESDEPFDIVSVYWDDIPSAVEALDLIPPRSLLPERALVACTPPTPNGGLHLGHLAGPYIRADMLVRGMRSMGREARHVTGTDDHQSYVAVAARMGSTTPAEVATAEGDAIVATWRAAEVGCDRLSRPIADQEHAERIGQLFSRVVASPAVRVEEHETAYCSGCDVSLHQAFARGRCPHCAAACDGEICEACGRPNEARELADPTCRLCGGPATTRSERALWLDMQAYADELRAYMARIHAGHDLRSLVESLLDAPGGLPRYRLTRTTDWGIAWGDGTGQAVDAWVELTLTFLDASLAEAETVGPAKATFFLGFDNTFYYAVLMPVLAFAAGVADHLPSGFVTNQFLHLGGEKFSTSRGHAVWADDALAAAGPDAVRLALLRNAPEGRVTGISQEAADGFEDDPLYREAHDWLAGFAGLLEKSGDAVPGTGAWTGSHREFYRCLNSLTQQLDGLLVPESFSARGYVRLLDAFIGRVAEFRAGEEALRRVPSMAEEARTGLALEYLAAKAFAGLAWPVMPDLAQRVWDWLGLPGQPRREAQWSFLPAGTTCASPEFGRRVGDREKSASGARS